MRLPFVKRTLDRTFLILCPVEQCEPMMNLLELAFSSGKRTDPPPPGSPQCADRNYIHLPFLCRMG